jgi:hypothetical protein
MIIPWQELAPEILENLIKEYVLSQLEDYQMESVQMEQWMEQVKRKLKNAEAVIEWSEANETATIVDARKYSNQITVPNLSPVK